MATKRNIAWQVTSGSSYINMVEWEYETDKNYCYRRKDGTVSKYLKHPVGTSRSYFPTWEEANAEVIRQAEADLQRTMAAITGKQASIAYLKKRTQEEAYAL